MQIDHIHFYVEDARETRDWFIQKVGFYSVPQEVCIAPSAPHTQTEVVANGSIYFVFSSALKESSPVCDFLSAHPPGVVDVAFGVENVEAVMRRAISQGATVLQPLQTAGTLKWAQIAAWGTLRHSLIERSIAATSRGGKDSKPAPNITFSHIDHVVLNVALGDLDCAVDWYETVLGFEPQQMFAIKTDRSGLCSRVMRYPNGQVQVPINEPTSENSQIQEFLDLNRGAGVQHIAIHTENIVEAIAQLRQAGLSFLKVPASYYTQVRQRRDCVLSDAQIAEIEAQQILVDWQSEMPEAVLLQTFTQPIFEQPTFFFELIERHTYRVDDRLHQAQGFGEGNFRALFEAIEREQLKRGSLKF